MNSSKIHCPSLACFLVFHCTLHHEAARLSAFFMVLIATRVFCSENCTMLAALRRLGFAFVILFVRVSGEDYVLDSTKYNQTCREQHPNIPGVFADHDRNFGGCRYICSHNEQRFSKDYLKVPNNTPCGRNKACIQGSCHYLPNIANCKSALYSDDAIIKVSHCRLKCSRPSSARIDDWINFDDLLPIPIFYREGLACQTLRYNGICLDGKCVKERTRSVQPRETIRSARTRKHTMPTQPEGLIYVKIDHYCRERYQDPRESIIGREVELSRGCQYFCEEPDVWESSEPFKAPDDIPCDPQSAKVCNHGNCRHVEDVAECRRSFNTTGAVIVSRVQDFPCSLKCTLPLLKGWRTAYEKRRPGVKCSNIYIRNGVCNKQGICIHEPLF